MKTLQILLIEDNEGDVEMTERALHDMKPPCNLAVAHNGTAALDFLLKRGRHAEAPSPALILLDLNMPLMDGKKFLEVAKADEQLRTIPIIMLTSSRSPADIRDCYERHANCYVVKPFDGREFMAAVRQIVTFWAGVSQLPA